MIRRGLMLILAIATALMIPMAVPAAAPADDFAARLDSQVPGWLAQYDAPGLLVAVIKDGQVAWENGYGLADRRTGRPMTPQTVMHYGSNGKLLTAWGIMKLAEQGQLELDAPASRYMKSWQFPAPFTDTDKITVRSLLNHTAGLVPRGYGVYHPRRKLPTLRESLSGVNESRAPLAQGFPPGQGPHYSSAHHAILQLIIEDVTGQAFEPWMQANITLPLGMELGAWEWTPALKEQAAQPYWWRGEPLPLMAMAEAGAGGFQAPFSEMARFVAAALPGPKGEPAGRGVLKPESLQAMMSTTQLGMGYGMNRFADGSFFAYHEGENPGWKALLAIDPEQRGAILIAANSNRAYPVEILVRDAWAEAMGKAIPHGSPYPPALLVPANVNARTLSILAGLLGMGALVMLVRLVLQLRSGSRASTPAPGVRGAVVASLWGLLGVALWYLGYSSLPLPWPATFPEIPLPKEANWAGMALFLWVAVGIARAILPPVRRTGAVVRAVGA